MTRASAPSRPDNRQTKGNRGHLNSASRTSGGFPVSSEVVELVLMMFVRSGARARGRALEGGQAGGSAGASACACGSAGGSARVGGSAGACVSASGSERSIASSSANASTRGRRGVEGAFRQMAGAWVVRGVRPCLAPHHRALSSPHQRNARRAATRASPSGFALDAFCHLLRAHADRVSTVSHHRWTRRAVHACRKRCADRQLPAAQR